MERYQKLLFIVLFSAILASVIVSYYRYIHLREFTVLIDEVAFEEAANSTEESE